MYRLLTTALIGIVFSFLSLSSFSTNNLLFATALSSYKANANPKNNNIIKDSGVVRSKHRNKTKNVKIYTNENGLKHHEGKFHQVNEKQKKELERLAKFRRRRKQAPMVFMLLLTIMVCGQIALFTWRKKHYQHKVLLRQTQYR